MYQFTGQSDSVNGIFSTFREMLCQYRPARISLIFSIVQQLAPGRPPNLSRRGPPLTPCHTQILNLLSQQSHLPLVRTSCSYRGYVKIINTSIILTSHNGTPGNGPRTYNDTASWLLYSIVPGRQPNLSRRGPPLTPCHTQILNLLSQQSHLPLVRTSCSYRGYVKIINTSIILTSHNGTPGNGPRTYNDTARRSAGEDTAGHRAANNGTARARHQ